MNQDQVKEKLLLLDSTVEDFIVTFSGKKSKKVDGLYKPEIREIIIHNKNFNDENPLIYTAIHEFAHHVHISRSPIPVSSRAHTRKFWEIFHRLLILAEEKNIYVNIFKKEKHFIELTEKLRKNYLNVDASLMKEFGSLLLEAFQLCMEHHASFDDYVDRELKLHRKTAKTIMNIHTRDINPDIGFENMKTVASIKDDDTMRLAEEAFLRGDSPDMVMSDYISKPEPADPLDKLFSEKEKIERSIERLQHNLVRIENRIKEFS